MSSMLPSYEQTLMKVPGINSQNIQNAREKIEWLRAKWGKQTDSDELRLISRLILYPTQQPYLSIVLDDVDSFKKPDDESQQTQILRMACLCGAKNIASFLLNALHAKYTSEDYDFILPYVCASNNLKWAREIAITLAEADVPMPSGIALFGDYFLIDEMHRIFNRQKKSEKINS